MAANVWPDMQGPQDLGGKFPQHELDVDIAEWPPTKLDVAIDEDTTMSIAPAANFAHPLSTLGDAVQIAPPPCRHRPRELDIVYVAVGSPPIDARTLSLQLLLAPADVYPRSKGVEADLFATP